MTRLINGMLALLLAGVTPLAAQLSVEGEWLANLTLPLGEVTFTMNIVQQGDKLTGYMLNESGQYDLTGVMQEDQVRIDWSFPDGGRVVDVSFRGRVMRNSMSGVARVGEVGEGSMSAQRK